MREVGLSFVYLRSAVPLRALICCALRSGFGRRSVSQKSRDFLEVPRHLMATRGNCRATVSQLLSDSKKCSDYLKRNIRIF